MGSDIAFGVGVPWLDGHFHMTVGAAAGITCKFHAPKCRSNGIETCPEPRTGMPPSLAELDVETAASMPKAPIL